MLYTSASYYYRDMANINYENGAEIAIFSSLPATTHAYDAFFLERNSAEICLIYGPANLSTGLVRLGCQDYENGDEYMEEPSIKRVGQWIKALNTPAEDAINVADKYNFFSIKKTSGEDQYNELQYDNLQTFQAAPFPGISIFLSWDENQEGDGVYFNPDGECFLWEDSSYRCEPWVVAYFTNNGYKI